MKNIFIGLLLASFFYFFLSALFNAAMAADTNTVSSTVVTNSTPPTANAPSVVVNNSDVCKTAASSAIQTQVLGFASGITITDENCERIKLARSLYSMGMKVAAVSLLSQDARVFDSMVMAGTPPPIFSKIGSDALDEWKKNPHLIPEGSKVFEKKEIEITTTKDNNEEFKKFIIAAMAMYIGFPILF